MTREIRVLNTLNRLMDVFEQAVEIEEAKRLAFIGPVATAKQMKELQHEQKVRETKLTGVVRGPASLAAILGNVYVQTPRR